VGGARGFGTGGGREGNSRGGGGEMDLQVGERKGGIGPSERGRNPGKSQLLKHKRGLKGGRESSKTLEWPE